MKTTLIGNLLTAIIKAIGQDEEIKDVVDAFLDKIEDKIANSPNKFDDAMILPLIGVARKALQVPDNDA